MPTRRAALMLLAAAPAAAACAPRVRIVEVAGAPGPTRIVHVATTRAPGPGTDFSDNRAPGLSYARYAVSVPPAHRDGRLELARRGPPDPARHFAVAAARRFPDAPSFRAALRAALSHDPRREAVVFVHGFNTTFAEGVFRTAQMWHDLAVPAAAVHYSWPSAANPLAYVEDRDSALFARDGLERLLGEVRAAGAAHVTLLAHSLGGFLAMEALRQAAIRRPDGARRLVDALVLVAPDLDVALFRAQARAIGRLPDPTMILTSRRDRALLLSARLTGQPARLGNLTDFRAVGDLGVVVVDVSALEPGGGLGHFAIARSEALHRIISALPSLDTALAAEQAGRTGLIPGTVLTIQNTTAIILSPLAGP